MKICENVYQIKIDFHVTEEIKRYVFVYLITGKDCYLVDSGTAGCEKIIADYMKKLGRDMKEIKAVFLTHAHPDHIGAAAAIKRISGCKIYAPEAEKEWIEDIEVQFRERPIPNFFSLVDESVEVDQTVKGGEQIFLEDGKEMRVLETAGHSAGSVSYMLEEDGILFVGDAIPVLDDFPIFIDEKASEEALNKILEQKRIRYCCPAWDRVYEGCEVKEILEKAITFLRRLKECVREVEADYDKETDEKRREIVCRIMGWENMKGNPLFAKSISACRLS